MLTMLLNMTALVIRRYYLMFGRHPRLAIDAFLGLQEHSSNDSDDSGQYVDKLKSRLDFAYKTAAAEAQKASERSKTRYDLRVRESILQPGDRVLVRNVALKGKSKLADKWEKETYVVISQPSRDIPVYKVRKEFVKGHVRTLHRNLLLPYMAIPPKPQVVPNPKKSMKYGEAEKSTREVQTYDTDSSTDSDNSQSEVYVIPQRRRNLNPCAPAFVPITDYSSVNDSSFQPRYSTIPFYTPEASNRQTHTQSDRGVSRLSSLPDYSASELYSHQQPSRSIMNDALSFQSPTIQRRSNRSSKTS